MPIPYRWRFWTRIMARYGYWTWEHPFKACPTGGRHCTHYHYHLGRPPGE